MSALKILLVTTDGRSFSRRLCSDAPHFGTAPQGLIDGLSELDGVQLHVASCMREPMVSPIKLATNTYFHALVVPKIGWMSTCFSGCIGAVRKLARELDVDIVHGQGTERDCAMDAVFSGVPNVLTIHGNMRVHAKRPECKGSAYYKMAAALESFCLKHTDGVVAISSYTRDMVAPLVRRTWLLPNAVDRRFFEVILQQPEVPRILFVGSLDQRKNPLGLLQACDGLLRGGKCTLAMAGQFHDETPYGREVRAVAETLPGVIFLGFLDRDALAREFSRSSLMVLPTFEDNCPMVVLEAMAAGLPVAASRVGGVPDLIEHGIDGLMFDPGDQADMQLTMETLINDPALRARMGTSGRAKAMERFQPRKIAEAHLAIYREVLGRESVVGSGFTARLRRQRPVSR